MAYILLPLYLLAFILFSSQILFINALGIIPLYVSSVIGAYKLHDYFHYNAGELKKVNRVKFTIVRWVSNSIYFDFNELRILHSRHHQLMIDNEIFSNNLFINDDSKILTKFIFFLEFFYIPIISYIQFYKLINMVLKDKSYKTNLLAVIAIKLAIIALMCYLNAASLIFYAIGSIFQINTLRFFDAFQHVYESFHISQSPRKKSSEYEKANTYTLVFPDSLKFIQALVLNFNIHNVHHLFPKIRWKELTEIDTQISDEYKSNQIPIGIAINLYHTNRLKRLVHGQGIVIDDESQKKRYSEFYGASALPFIYGVYRSCKRNSPTFNKVNISLSN